MLGPDSYSPRLNEFIDQRETIEKTVVSAIQTLTGLVVIRQSQLAEMPDYPFITYSTISETDDKLLYIPPEYYEKNEGGLLYTTMYHDVTTTISLTARSEKANEAKKIARFIRQWLRYGQGHFFEDNAAAIIVDVGRIGERNTAFDTIVEYGEGFDFGVRWLETITQAVESIDSLSVTNE